MTKWRVLIFLSTLLVVGVVGLFVSFYARGYRLDFKTLKFSPNGIFVVKSEPDGASVYINGELRTATNATLSLAPGTYDVEVKKDGFLPWYKRLTIEKEIVTQASVSLFKSAPSLAPLTFSGAASPIESEDGTKIAYIDKDALWVIDIANLPLGFGRDPKKITDGDLTNATFEFSPDSRQILLTTSQGIFLLDSGSFTPQGQRTNITSKKVATLAEWEIQKKEQITSLLKPFPAQISEVLGKRTSKLVLSPDEQMILYTASSEGTLAENLVRPLPGASTQKQERTIKAGSTYIYDIKEDRNFLVSNLPEDKENVRWMPSSRHVLLAQEGSVVIMDYDGTNKQTVYSGAYVAPIAYPYTNTTRILILTNLGSDTSTPNLYSLTLK